MTTPAPAGPCTTRPPSHPVRSLRSSPPPSSLPPHNSATKMTLYKNRTHETKPFERLSLIRKPPNPWARAAAPSGIIFPISSSQCLPATGLDLRLRGLQHTGNLIERRFMKVPLGYDEISKRAVGRVGGGLFVAESGTAVAHHPDPIRSVQPVEGRRVAGLDILTPEICGFLAIHTTGST